MAESVYCRNNVHRRTLCRRGAGCARCRDRFGRRAGRGASECGRVHAALPSGAGVVGDRHGAAVTLRVERALLREAGPGALLAAIDEVGRGALAGPVAVGVVVIAADSAAAPRGVRDSKECDRATRERLAPRVRAWARRSAVGMASSVEIDSIGIISALALAFVVRQPQQLPVPARWPHASHQQVA